MYLVAIACPAWPGPLLFECFVGNIEWIADAQAAGDFCKRGAKPFILLLECSPAIAARIGASTSATRRVLFLGLNLFGHGRPLVFVSRTSYISRMTYRSKPLRRPLTQKVVLVIPPRVGRKKRWSEDMGARFPEGTFARITAVLRGKEDRTDFVRDAVERELKRREKLTTPEKGRPNALPK